MEKELIIPTAQKLVDENADLLNPERWESLDRNQKRKAILLDAMKYILVGTYRPRSSYTDRDLLWVDTERRHGSLKDVLELNQHKCFACQRGLLLLSCVRFNNVVTMEDYGSMSIDRNEMSSGIAEFFSARERFLMEACFENDYVNFNKKYSDTAYSDFDPKFTRRSILSIAIFLNAYLLGDFAPEEWAPEVR